jgi:hypothetical protein
MDQIKKSVEEIQKCVRERDESIDFKTFQSDMSDKYSEFREKYPTIFEKVLENSLDIERFNYMLNMAKKIDNKEMTNHDASVKVGERLVDEFVKPNLKK